MLRCFSSSAPLSLSRLEMTEWKLANRPYVVGKDTVENIAILNLGGAFFPWIAPAESVGKLRLFSLYSVEFVSSF
jgi:hypothetical protein